MANRWTVIKDFWDLVIKNNPTTKIRGDAMNAELDRLVDEITQDYDSATGEKLKASVIGMEEGTSEVATPARTDKLLIDQGGTNYYVEAGDLALKSDDSVTVSDPGQDTQASITFSRTDNGHDPTYYMSISNTGVGLDITGMENNDGLLFMFEAADATHSLDPNDIAVADPDSNAHTIEFITDFDWSNDWGGSGTRYWMVIEVVNNVALVGMIKSSTTPTT